MLRFIISWFSSPVIRFFSLLRRHLAVDVRTFARIFPHCPYWLWLALSTLVPISRLGKRKYNMIYLWHCLLLREYEIKLIWLMINSDDFMQKAQIKYVLWDYLKVRVSLRSKQTRGVTFIVVNKNELIYVLINPCSCRWLVNSDVRSLHVMWLAGKNRNCDVIIITLFSKR